jgi:uncharacterized protein YcaQ
MRAFASTACGYRGSARRVPPPDKSSGCAAGAGDRALRPAAPSTSLGELTSRLRYPRHSSRLSSEQRSCGRAPPSRTHVGDVDWYWPAGEEPLAVAEAGDLERARFVAPFDPLVWDRRRFELFWGWAYRFEAYTPIAKRKLGYYALPVLWRDDVVGWANVTLKEQRPVADVGYVAGRPPRGHAFRRELEAELARLAAFL